MAYKDPERKRARAHEDYIKRRAKLQRNLKLCLKYMKGPNRPKFKVQLKGEFPGGLTEKEIEIWCERVSKIRTLRLTNTFKPEVRRWRDGV